jgi:hypothetical protein
MKSLGFAFAATLVLTCTFTIPAMAQSAVKQVRGPIWISMTATAAPLQSIQVTPPASGYIMVTVTGTVTYEHTLGTQGYYCLQLSQASANLGGCVPNTGSDSAIRSYIAAEVPTTVPGYGASEQYSIVRIWHVTSGTTYTFYLNGMETGLDSTFLFQPSITAVFIRGALP